MSHILRGSTEGSKGSCHITRLSECRKSPPLWVSFQYIGLLLTWIQIVWNSYSRPTAL